MYNNAPVRSVYKTNYEKIREMSVQKLADFLCRLNEGNSPLNTDDFLCDKYNEATDCECEQILKAKGLTCIEISTENGYCPLAMEWWLKQEAAK